MLFYYSFILILGLLAVFSVGFYTAVLWFDFSTKKEPPKIITPVKTELKNEPTELPIIHKKIEVWQVGNDTEILDSSYQMAWNLQK